MRQRINLACVLLVLSTGLAGAQTTMMSMGGTTNAAPVYTWSSTVGNSQISVAKSSVGIETM
jgi:hypothetical protein